MGGPIVREGRVILSVELAIPSGGGANPVAAEMVAQQTAIAQATGESSAAVQEATLSNAALAAGIVTADEATAAWAAHDAELAAAEAEVAVATGEAVATTEAAVVATTAAYEATAALTEAELAAVAATDGAAVSTGALAESKGVDTAATVVDTAATERLALANAQLVIVEGGAAVATGVLATAEENAALAASLEAAATWTLTGAVVALESALLPVVIVLEIAAGLAYGLYKAYEYLTDNTKALAEAEKEYHEELALSNAEMKLALEERRDLAKIGDSASGKDKELAKQLLTAKQDKAIVNTTLDKIIDSHDEAANAEIAGGGLVKLENQKAIIGDELKLKKQIADESEKDNKHQQRAIEIAERKLEEAEKKLQHDKQAHGRGGGHHARTIAEDQASLEKAQQGLSSLTGGKTASAALKELQDANDQTIKEATKGRDELNALLNDIISDITTLKTVQQAAKAGAQIAARQK